MTNLAAIVAAMRRQADTAGLAERLLSGGLLLKLRRRDDSLYLSLGRKTTGPGVEERERWVRAFGVPGEAFGFRYVVGEYRFVQYEWKEKENGKNQSTSIG